ncbi:MAG TPA: ABC transporter ATP-binding protein [Clostridiales bacterium]|nr:ABC transporter ATP-binding protein [Clostridiales bacterium]
MKLIYELPNDIKEKYPDLLTGKTILYCLPVDIDLSGNFFNGYVAVTQDYILYLSLNSTSEVYRIKDYEFFESTAEVGDGILIGRKVDGESYALARFSMRYVPRFKFIARALNQILTIGKSKVVSTDDDNICPKCGRTFAQGTNICPSCINKGDMFRKLISIASSKWYLYLIVSTIFIAITALRLVNPQITRNLIDNYINAPDTVTPDVKDMLFLVGLMGVIMVFSSFLTILRGRVMAKVGAEMAKDLRSMVYEKIQSLSLGYIGKRKTGDLMNRITGDTDRISNFMVHTAPNVVNELLTMTGILIIMFTFNWKLALIVLIPVPFILIVMRLFRSFIRNLYRKQWRQSDRANSLLQDIISGIRVVKSFGKEKYAINQFKNESKKLADITIYNEKTWQTLFPGLMFVMGIGSFFIMLIGGRMVLNETMKVGELVQFTTYAGMLYGPLNMISFFPRAISEVATSTERIFDVIDQDPDIKESPSAISHEIQGEIAFDNVTFGYQSYEPVLENIDITINPGEMLGLVGHSGAGKSTFINLVMRLYDVDEGSIKIDGIDIRNIRKEDLNRQIGVVLQETFLFSGSILDNVRYSKPDATAEEIILACKLANAHDFIVKFPDGYDTIVGERGHRVSGGERQRISIARAILSNPRILILDEATSSLDTNTELKIQEALTRLVKGRTTIAIAHRLSTLKFANRLLVVDKGKKAELGTHKELMDLKGIYYGLVSAQLKMSE